MTHKLLYSLDLARCKLPVLCSPNVTSHSHPLTVILLFSLTRWWWHLHAMVCTLFECGVCVSVWEEVFELQGRKYDWIPSDFFLYQQSQHAVHIEKLSYFCISRNPDCMNYRVLSLSCCSYPLKFSGGWLLHSSEYSLYPCLSLPILQKWKAYLVLYGSLLISIWSHLSLHSPLFFLMINL